MEPAKGVIIGEKYVLERVLGHGGMGSVWLAHHWKLGAPVAIKLLRTEHTRIELARARFEREAMMMAKLRSRHVISVNDYGVQDNHAYIVMEMLVGEDLNERIQRVGQLSPEEVHFIIGQAARGLVVAHEAGIIHRDLKPANIFIAEQDREEMVKLLDFGIAKAMEGPMMGGRLTGSKGESETKTGVLLGSPHYMSPEHIQGDWDIVDHRSDLWALGVITYRALTGQLPFPGDTLPTVMIGICKNDPDPPRKHVPSLPPALDDFFAQALAKPRDERFDSATQLAHALAHALDMGPTSSKGVSIRPSAASSPSLPAMDGSTRDTTTASDLQVTRERALGDGVTVALDQMPTLEREDKPPVAGSPPRGTSKHPAPVPAPGPRQTEPMAAREVGTGSLVTESTFIGESQGVPTMTAAAVTGALLLLGVTGGALAFLARDEPAAVSARTFLRGLPWLTEVPAPSSGDEADDAGIEPAPAPSATAPAAAPTVPAAAPTGPRPAVRPRASRASSEKKKKKFNPGY